MKSTVEGSMVAERFDDGEKDKKKRRRSNRRNKQNPPSSSGLVTEVNEAIGVSVECSGKNGTPTQSSGSFSNSLKQQGVIVFPSNEQELSKAPSVESISMPVMSLHDQGVHEGGIVSKPFSEPIGCLGSSTTYKKNDSSPYNQIGLSGQRNFFSPHWPVEAVEKALERGDVFKAVFRVNAHNKLEAYCKIDGVPTDILIGGAPAQNRAVEGDMVAIKLDPLPLWTKMKGPNVTNNNTAVLEGCSNLVEDNVVGDNNGEGNRSCPAQSKGESYPCLEKRYIYENNTTQGLPNHLSLIGLTGCDNNDDLHYDASASLKINSRSGQSEVMNAVEKLCLLVNSFPSKRPTGRVIAVIERSPRRECIIGHLNVKQWVFFRDTNKKDARKNKNLVSENEYIHLRPIDPKFPNIILLVRELPESIAKRLKSGDGAIEMDLVAAQIDDWFEESPFPEGHILHIFGRGSEIQPQLDAILFQNAICTSEFSPEALSCLPHVPWELPLKELQNRTDLRNLCIFTIDPSTATDLDDALSIEKLPNGNYRVGIHITDASYFVLPDTALDREAKFRSTSVYMLQKKLPMLPALISENIGSLNPGVDRLAFSMLLDLNVDGDVVDRWIGRTVIQSCCKLSYEHAQDIIDRDFDLESSTFHEDDYPKVHGHFDWSDVITSLKSLYEISKVLKYKRFTGGALRLDNPKIVILFDENGIPYDSTFSEQKESNFLIEEYMLLANTTAAEVICKAYPDVALLRRHPEPNMQKLRECTAFCQKHGLNLDTSSSGHIHRSLEKIKKTLKDDPVLYDIFISYATRPMQLASYFCSGDFKDNEHEWGHYALAVPLYTHFTSPLRRYPDIVVHRTLLATIEAEEIYLKQVGKEVGAKKRCFTGTNFDKKAAESVEGMEALSAAALKHRVPSAETLAVIAAHCNERKRASRNVKDACERLYIWFLLKQQKVILSEARILGLGPKFMSIYIQKLAVERRIYYDEVDGLTAEWLEATSTLVLSISPNKRASRRGGANKWRSLSDSVLLACPYDLKVTTDNSKQNDAMEVDAIVSNMDKQHISQSAIEPAFFPLTVHLLSTIPVALHAVGGDDGPLDFGVRLYMSSYFV
ncbi:DIS3-like exonuclease 2 isoform X1 [Trifolium pratense]|uniref:DIS3-like exonuclease 2 isoform X1 n=2 Tax=Trifolium pratense TaxID=57577 RepID=UPI001E69511D|nr:DIS3-like exonuclease 2 isoform X1 [Trifolium pratense]